ncbi:MAG: flagellar hook-associated protein 1 FlgK [Alphaproteobacteria bacterium]|jgi:flagellar hook-associated protein 1 FlgK
MSLNIALQNAISGLQTNSRALDVTAQNVANVNTIGYSSKSVNQQAVVIAGQGAGVEIASITRTVNEFMILELRDAVTEMGDVEVRDDYYARMQNLFGTLSSDTSPAIGIAELATKFQALADTPENVSLRTDLVERARLLTEQFVDIAEEIEDLRIEVDRAIEDAVTEINTQLTLVKKLNIQVAEGIVLNQGVGELQDQRDVALTAIAELMELQQFTRSNGEIVVLSKAGRTLVDGNASILSHTAVSGLNPQATHASGAIDTIDLNGVDITNEIRSGRIAGYVALRDTLLPNLHSQMQELTTVLHDEINILHNQGTAYPGLASVTGSRSFDAADPPIWTGNFRVAVTDSSGTIVELQDIDLTAVATVGDLATAINGMTNLSASLNTAGKMVILPNGANRIAFNELDSAVTLGNQTMGASNFLGLNDFFTSSNEYNEYNSAYQTTSTTAKGLTGTLTFAGDFGASAVNYTAGNSLDDITAAINADATLLAAGVTASIITDGSGYRLRINEPTGTNFFISDSGSLTDTIDLKIRNPQIVSQISIRGDAVNDPSLVARGTLSNSPTLAVGDVGLSTGDKSAAQAIANRFNNDLAFTATNLLAGSNSTLSEYAAEILSLNAAQANAATDTLDAREILVDNLKARTGEISGVNLDEELSRMIILENAYAASARVITTTQNLFEILTAMGR